MTPDFGLARTTAGANHGPIGLREHIVNIRSNRVECQKSPRAVPDNCAHRLDRRNFPYPTDPEVKVIYSHVPLFDPSPNKSCLNDFRSGWQRLAALSTSDVSLAAV